jgi:site-specific DNA recombinase
VLTFCDREISGASIINRPGFQDLMRAAEARRFDVIVAEDVDRISRDQGDWHAARKRLDFLGIAIHTASGKVGKLDRHAGGRAYGYRAIAGKPGELEIDQAEAEIVRRIFCEFVEGKTPREIAAGLNADCIKPPRGRNWNASTINGNAARGHGMLINELYAGRIVWNKIRMIKDPATGRRVPRPNRNDQYLSVEAPQLAIVEDATFKAAQVIKAGRSHQGASQSRKAVRPLSGLLRCGSCGADTSAIGAQRKGKPHRMQCSAFRESGVCSNGRKVSRQAIEALVFEGLRDELANPEAIAEYVRAPTTPSAGAWPRRVATARSICSAATASSTARSIA